jgi:RNase P/RNase MRP subunit p29
MPEERLMRRRLPAIEKKIADIQPESDVRVRITGTVIDISTNSVVIDDGSGKAEVYFDEQQNVHPGQFIRIITRILPLIDGFECRGEVIQTMDGFNLDLYKKTKEIIREVI